MQMAYPTQPNAPRSCGLIPVLTAPYGQPQDMNVGNLYGGNSGDESNVGSFQEQGQIFHPTQPNVLTSSGVIPNITEPYGKPQDTNDDNLPGGNSGNERTVGTLQGQMTYLTQPIEPITSGIVPDVGAPNRQTQDTNVTNVPMKIAKKQSNVDSTLELEHITHPTLYKLLTSDFVVDRRGRVIPRQDESISIGRGIGRNNVNVGRSQKCKNVPQPASHGLPLSLIAFPDISERKAPQHVPVDNLSRGTAGYGPTLDYGSTNTELYRTRPNVITSTGVVSGNPGYVATPQNVSNLYTRPETERIIYNPRRYEPGIGAVPVTRGRSIQDRITVRASRGPEMQPVMYTTPLRNTGMGIKQLMPESVTLDQSAGTSSTSTSIALNTPIKHLLQQGASRIVITIPSQTETETSNPNTGHKPRRQLNHASQRKFFTVTIVIKIWSLHGSFMDTCFLSLVHAMRHTWDKARNKGPVSPLLKRKIYVLLSSCCYSKSVHGSSISLSI
ncbi:hypothetical protein J6590_081083 [Homalodisca vitripennis]|nr:hypothetical protein J6590_081083 [Homalodisca vitripennis]